MVPATALCEVGWVVISSVATPVAVKLWRSILDSVMPATPAWVACNVMRPGAVGVTVKTPPTGPLIPAEPIEPGTTVSAMAKPELADGVTVNEPAAMARSRIAAKLTDCHVVLTEPVV